MFCVENSAGDELPVSLAPNDTVHSLLDLINVRALSVATVFLLYPATITGSCSLLHLTWKASSIITIVQAEWGLDRLTYTLVVGASKFVLESHFTMRVVRAMLDSARSSSVRLVELSSPGAFEVRVKGLTGAEQVVHMNATDTIEALKEKIWVRLFHARTPSLLCLVWGLPHESSECAFNSCLRKLRSFKRIYRPSHIWTRPLGLYVHELLDMFLLRSGLCTFTWFFYIPFQSRAAYSAPMDVGT